MICKKCGNNVKSDFKFCPYCGERVISDFHDHYEELSPPYVIHRLEDDEEDLSARFYAQDPDEQAPDFETPVLNSGKISPDYNPKRVDPDRQSSDYNIRSTPPYADDRVEFDDLPHTPPQSSYPQNSTQESHYYIYHPDDDPPFESGQVYTNPPFTHEHHAQSGQIFEDTEYDQHKSVNASSWQQPEFDQRELPNTRPWPQPEFDQRDSGNVPPWQKPVLDQHQPIKIPVWQEPEQFEDSYSKSSQSNAQPSKQETNLFHGPGIGIRIVTIFIALGLAVVVSFFGYRIIKSNFLTPDQQPPSTEVDSMFADIRIPEDASSV